MFGLKFSKYDKFVSRYRDPQPQVVKKFNKLT